MPRRLVAAVALGVALTLGLLLPALLHHVPALAGSNTRVIRGKNIVQVAPGRTRCQGGEFLPSGATSLSLLPRAVSPTAQPFSVTIAGQGGVVASARSAGGYRLEALDRFALQRRVAGDVYPATLCIHNAGRAALGLEGNLQSSNPEAPPAENAPYQRGSDEVRVDYHRPGKTARIAEAGDVARRWSLFRPGFFGPWLMWVVLAAFIALGAATVARFLRELRA